SSPERTDSCSARSCCAFARDCCSVASSYSRISRWRSFALARSEADSLGKPDLELEADGLCTGICWAGTTLISRDTRSHFLPAVSRLSLVYSDRPVPSTHL